jgi:hypothetical protein
VCCACVVSRSSLTFIHSLTHSKTTPTPSLARQHPHSRSFLSSHSFTVGCIDQTLSLQVLTSSLQPAQSLPHFEHAALRTGCTTLHGILQTAAVLHRGESQRTTGQPGNRITVRIETRTVTATTVTPKTTVPLLFCRREVPSRRISSATDILPSVQHWQCPLYPGQLAD